MRISDKAVKRVLSMYAPGTRVSVPRARGFARYAVARETTLLWGLQSRVVGPEDFCWYCGKMIWSGSFREAHACKKKGTKIQILKVPARQPWYGRKT